MKPKVYIDGQAGTTGLQIASRLENRSDIELLKLPDDKRHDNAARRAMMEQADLVFLCLPDSAAVEAAAMCPAKTKLIDASTAHRTSWTYGFPELSAAHQKEIQQAVRVANPGCHATGMIALIYPLIAAGLLKPDTFLSIFSLTGYSGGGKQMIADYQSMQKPGHENLEAARPYALGLQHKHLPEMVKITGLKTTPALIPVVDNYYKGMLSTIAIHPSMLTRPMSREDLADFYHHWYSSAPLITIRNEPAAKLAADQMAGSDGLVIYINGNDEQILLQAVFDNLGKGASGAAVENMNLMLGLDPMAGLNL